MMEVQNSVVQLCCYSYSDYGKPLHFNGICHKDLSDTGEMCLVLILSL